MRQRHSMKTPGDIQFQAVSNLNVKLNELLNEKESQIKEIHRNYLVETDLRKKIERELSKQA